jgi:hypothetical protein
VSRVRGFKGRGRFLKVASSAESLLRCTQVCPNAKAKNVTSALEIGRMSCNKRKSHAAPRELKVRSLILVCQ